MPGEQHVMTGRQATEDVILNHVIGLIFEEQVAFVLIHVHAQRPDFLVFQRIDRRLRINQRPRLVLITITPSFICSNAA